METVERTDETRQELERVERLEEDVATMKDMLVELAVRTNETRDRTLGISEREAVSISERDDWLRMRLVSALVEATATRGTISELNDVDSDDKNAMLDSLSRVCDNVTRVLMELGLSRTDD